MNTEPHAYAAQGFVPHAPVPDGHAAEATPHGAFAAVHGNEPRQPALRPAPSGPGNLAATASAVADHARRAAAATLAALGPGATWVRENPGKAGRRATIALAVIVTVQNAAFGQMETHAAPWFGPRAVAQAAALETERATSPAAARPQARLADPVVFGLQSELTDRGFYDGAIDGVQGPRTRAAIEAYEASVGIPARGDATSALLERMRLGPVASLPRPSAKPAETGDAMATGSVSSPEAETAREKVRIRAIQEGLVAYGQEIAADGVMGPMTRAAIEEFEGAHGMEPTGEASEALLVRMRAEGLIRP